MARQDFLNGGYIGKLGATVGERWKNIRYIRTYVVPHNPRTPAQVADRAQFARAIRLAQASLAMSRGDPQWQSASRTEWQMRTSFARRNLLATGDITQSFPGPSTAWTGVRVYQYVAMQFDPVGRTLSLTCADTGTPGERWVTAILVLMHQPTGQWVYIPYGTQQADDGKLNISYNWDVELAVGPDCYVAAMTTDWAQYPGDYCYLVPQILQP